MAITDYDISILDDIMVGEGTWFTAHLLRLMGKADLDNLRRLAVAFPDEFVEFCTWKWKGVPYHFITSTDIRDYVNSKILDNPDKYRWLNPNTGEAVKVTLTHGRDF